MTGRRQFLAFTSLLAAVPWAPAGAADLPGTPGQTSLPLAVDLAADGRVAGQQNIPVLLLFSLPGCPYCESVRRSCLQPLQAERPPRARVRQIDIDAKRALKDFQGNTLTHQAFATREGITLTPVVGFYGANGERVAERLVGAMIPDFYGSYLDEALGKAAAQIRAAKAQKTTRR